VTGQADLEQVSSPADMLEVIVFVGLQGAGKSTFYAQRFAATHVLVSKDRLRTNRRPERRQRRLIAEALAAGRSVVVAIDPVEQLRRGHRCHREASVRSEQPPGIVRVELAALGGDEDARVD
jgi:hypothetical protein